MRNWILFLLIAICSACHKSDTIAPVITLSSPTADQVYAAGQMVTVSANITDDTGIHMVHLIVTDNTGGHLIHFEEHFDGKNYTLNQSFSTQAGKIYTIHIDAADHDDNVANKDLTVSAN
jgi:hypothetical protein